MHSKLLFTTILSSLSLVQAEEVLGVYIFHRHGDRTAKAWTPVNLTALGAEEVHSSGVYYRNRYVDNGAGFRVKGMSSNDVVLGQIEATSPMDAVLQNSATVFLQGLYPPSGSVEVLANGTRVEGPLNGYQYIPVHSDEQAASSKNSEQNAWLQGNSGCAKAQVSSNSYFSSPEYRKTYDESKSFYQSLLPVINGTYGTDDATFKNGYTIFDLINVATIHNSSIPSSDLLTDSTLRELYSLASIHEWNLAFSSSDPVRAIAGAVLGGHVVEALEAVVNGKSSAPKFNVQFGAYGTFMAFFGLAQLDKVSPDFRGVCDYASSMTFELVTNSTASNPDPEDVAVRFYFSNGTAAENKPTLFPLFGQKETSLKWNDFKSGMMKFSIEDTNHWCDVCGNADGACARTSSNGDSDSATAATSSNSDNGISKPVAGVIGALVTLVVILGLETAVMFLGGLRLVKKSTLQAAANPSMAATKA